MESFLLGRVDTAHLELPPPRLQTAWDQAGSAWPEFAREGQLMQVDRAARASMQNEWFDRSEAWLGILGGSCQSREGPVESSLELTHPALLARALWVSVRK